MIRKIIIFILAIVFTPFYLLSWFMDWVIGDLFYLRINLNEWIEWITLKG